MSITLRSISGAGGATIATGVVGVTAGAVVAGGFELALDTFLLPMIVCLILTSLATGAAIVGEGTRIRSPLLPKATVRRR